MQSNLMTPSQAQTQLLAQNPQGAPVSQQNAQSGQFGSYNHVTGTPSTPQTGMAGQAYNSKELVIGYTTKEAENTRVYLDQAINETRGVLLAHAGDLEKLSSEFRRSHDHVSKLVNDYHQKGMLCDKTMAAYTKVLEDLDKKCEQFNQSDMQVRILQSENETLKKEVALSKETILDLKECIEKANKVIQTIGTEKDDANQKLSRLERQLEEAAVKAATRSEELSSVSNELGLSRSEVAKLSAENKSLGEKCDNIVKGYSLVMDDVDTMKGEIEFKDKMYNDLLMEKSERDTGLAVANSKNEMLSSELESTKTQLASISSEFTSKEQVINGLISELNITKEKLDQAEKNRSDGEDQIKEQQYQLELKSGEVTQLNSHINNLLGEVRKAQAGAYGFEESSKINDARFQEARTVLREVKDKLDTERKEVASLKQKLQESEETIEGLRKHILSLNSELTIKGVNTQGKELLEQKVELLQKELDEANDVENNLKLKVFQAEDEVTRLEESLRVSQGEVKERTDLLERYKTDLENKNTVLLNTQEKLDVASEKYDEMATMLDRSNQQLKETTHQNAVLKSKVSQISGIVEGEDPHSIAIGDNQSTSGRLKPAVDKEFFSNAGQDYTTGLEGRDAMSYPTEGDRFVGHSAGYMGSTSEDEHQQLLATQRAMVDPSQDQLDERVNSILNLGR